MGFPGSIHDARVLRLLLVSGIFDLAENEECLSAPTRIIQWRDNVLFINHTFIELDFFKNFPFRFSKSCVTINKIQTD